MRKNTKKNTVVVAPVAPVYSAARPARKQTTASILTKEIHTNKLVCPECKGVNGLHRINQPCDFCGFMLKVRLFPDFSRYVRGLGVTASGRDTLDIGDSTADDLRELSVDKVVAATAAALAQMPIEIGLSTKMQRQWKVAGFEWTAEGVAQWIRERYEGRNNGMVRMNCGNILREARKRNA